MTRRKKFQVALRVAIWRANGKNCFYCAEPLTFSDLEIDHLIPRSTSASKLAALLPELALAADFSLDHPQNLVPAHDHCNRRKGNIPFTETSLRYYMELWRARQDKLKAEMERFRRQSDNDNMLAVLAARIEAGHLETAEVVRFLTANARPSKTREPTILAFSVLLKDVDETDDRELQGIPIGPRNYDLLLRRLRDRIAAEVPMLHTLTEDVRDGETISVRFAFWNLDVERLDEVDLTPWQLTEVTRWSDVYLDSDWDDLFPQATIQTYHAVIRDPRDKVFGLARCPKCASTSLERRSGAHPSDGDTYYFIKCLACDFSDWTQ